MRTRLTTEDIKNIAENIFNGNLNQVRADSSIDYKNDYSEKISIINEVTGEQTEKDLAEYLNIHFYAWKNRIVNVEDLDITERMTPFDAWVQSLNISMDSAFALVEIVDEEVEVSQDIDNAIKSAQITFLIQTDKVSNLDYYITKIRNELLGKVQTLQNQFGKRIKAYINVGSLMYESEPETLQFGSCIQCSCGFEISYMADALSYENIKVSLSLDGENGTYYEIPITKATYQMICSGNAEPTAERPDLTGIVNTTTSRVKTFSFYDFNTNFNNQLNAIFWKQGAYKYKASNSSQFLAEIKDPNIPVFVKIETQGYIYLYKDVITEIEKVVTNGDFNITSLTLKGYGKIG